MDNYHFKVTHKIDSLGFTSSATIELFVENFTRRNVLVKKVEYDRSDFRKWRASFRQMCKVATYAEKDDSIKLTFSSETDALRALELP